MWPNARFVQLFVYLFHLFLELVILCFGSSHGALRYDLSSLVASTLKIIAELIEAVPHRDHRLVDEQIDQRGEVLTPLKQDLAVYARKIGALNEWEEIE
jgi:hypothetical protein